MSNLLNSYLVVNGGAMRDRTADLLDANQTLSQLSYGPKQNTSKARSSNRGEHLQERLEYLFKEVIQPQVPLRLPCYDFTPVMNHKVVTVLPKVRLATSFATHSHGVTGGVYKARERIHRDILIHDY